MAKIIDFKTRQVIADLPTYVKPKELTFIYRVKDTGFDDKIYILASDRAAALRIIASVSAALKPQETTFFKGLF